MTKCQSPQSLLQILQNLMVFDGVNRSFGLSHEDQNPPLLGSISATFHSCNCKISIV